jgi:hypothetical protein
MSPTTRGLDTAGDQYGSRRGNVVIDDLSRIDVNRANNAHRRCR